VAEQLCELGYYTLAGHSNSPRDCVQETRDAETLGLGAAFISERFNLKDACTLAGAVGAVSTTLGVANSATNHNTRHPLVTATHATTMHRLTNGRFALGLGRGFDRLFGAIGLEPVTMAQLEDFVGIMRRLWRGEMILGHDGPAGKYTFLHQDATFDEDIPVMMVALGAKTLEFAGGLADGVMLHTYFSDDALARSVAAVRRGAERAGRDPNAVRIWSVLATIGDHIPPDARLLKTVGRLATYLQGYGDLLISVNQWDPAVLERFRGDVVVQSIQGGIDSKATGEQLEHIATLIPQEWLDASATGSPQRCATRVNDQFAAGATDVILHGASPAELTPVLDAYRAVRLPRFAQTVDPNPGRPRP
jgi:probable F420-dependent oxidoreductase